MKHWLCERAKSNPCTFAPYETVASPFAGDYSMPVEDVWKMRRLWRQIDPTITLGNHDLERELATLIRDHVTTGRNLGDNENKGRAADLESEFGIPHPGKFKDGDPLEQRGRMLGSSKFRATWDGSGNSFTVTIEASGDQWDMDDGPLKIKVVGELEWRDFVEFVNGVDTVSD